MWLVRGTTRWIKAADIAHNAVEKYRVSEIFKKVDVERVHAARMIHPSKVFWLDGESFQKELFALLYSKPHFFSRTGDHVM
jgi:hypothetical protein